MTFAYEASAGELRREFGRIRRAHSDRTLWQVAQDAYITVFAVALLGAMVVSTLSDIADRVNACGSDACSLARGPMALAVLLIITGAALRGLSTLGPVVASRAAAFWLLSTPADRGVLLRRTLVLSVLGSAAGAGALLAFAATVAGTQALGVVTAAAIGVSIGVLVAGVCALVQSSQRNRYIVGRAGDLVLLTAAAGIALVAFGQSLGDASWLVSPWSLPVTAALGVGALVVLVLSMRGLVRLALPEIVSGGELLSGLAGAAYALDPALLGEIIVARRFRMLGASSSRRGRLFGAAAIAEREFRRLGRTPGRFVVLVALAVVPQLFDQAGLAPVGPLSAGVAGYAAVRWSASGFRRVWLTPGLRRALPFAAPALLGCLTLPVAVLSALWSGAAAAALSPPWFESVLAVGLSIFAGVVRAAAARRPDYSGPLITSPMGAIPPGLFVVLIRGPDVALLGTIALAAGAPPLLTIGIPTALVAVVVAMAVATVSGGLGRAPRSPAGHQHA